MTTVYPLLAEPDLVGHRGFILAEDDALKAHLTGLKVPPRPESTPDEFEEVGVWFRFPQGERQIQYPFITIDLLTVEPDYNLFTSVYWQDTHKLYRPDFSPTLPIPPDGWPRQDWRVMNYLPFRLVYQVSHFARSALHDRYLMSLFMTDVFPCRPFFLHVAADDTMRRVEILSYVQGDAPETTESGSKRIFRKMYTLSMLAEIPQDRLLDNAVYKALRVLIPVVAQDQFDEYRRKVLDDNPDPINTVSQEDRDLAGEYFHITHEGHEMPTPP